jgi:putative restriction endonuclease
MRKDVAELQGRLAESEFGFVPDGERSLNGDIYSGTREEYPSLCDDDYLCSDSCSGGHDQPEWKHAVRRVLDMLKNSPESRVNEHDKRGVWRFGDVDSVEVTELPKTQTTEYETTTTTRNLRSGYRRAVLSRYGECCLLSEVDHPRLLDVAHILPWSEHEEQRQNLENIVLLSKIHHAAFDFGLFTIDSDFRVRNKPGFTTESDFLRETLLEREGERIELPASAEINADNLRKHNESLEWYSI